MATLRELRKEAGLTLAEISQQTAINIPSLSNYENHNIQPCLEDMVILEQLFKQRITWEDAVPEEILNSIISLYKKYPARSVTTFIQKNLQKDIVYGKSMIKHFAKTSESIDEFDPLIYNF